VRHFFFRIAVGPVLGRLSPLVAHDVPLQIELGLIDFTPERFHSERVTSYGVFAGRDGALNRIRLRMVSPENLAALAAIPWVARIEPLK